MNKKLLNPLAFALLLSAYATSQAMQVEPAEVKEFAVAEIVNPSSEIPQGPYRSAMPILQRPSPETLEAVLKKAAEGVNKQDEFGNTPLHYAAEKGEIYKAKFLIAQDADLQIKNHAGQTAADVAQEEGNQELAMVLIAEQNK